MSQPQESQQRHRVLSASAPDARYLVTLLRGVSFVNRATVTITCDGFVVTVEEARSLLATAFVYKEMFEEYTYHPEVSGLEPHSTPHTTDNPAFEIPLNALIECLNLFGTSSGLTTSKTKKWKQNAEDGGMDYDNDRTGPLDGYFPSSGKGTALRMSYEVPGDLILNIAEDAAGPAATCKITTYEPEAQLELPFEENATVLKIILKSSWLSDALSEMETSSYEKIKIISNPPPSRARAPRKPLLRIHAAGPFGSCEMDYPDDKEVLETFECEGPVSFSYKLSHISRAIRALQNSTKTSLRIDNGGLLSMQLLMPYPKPRGGSSKAFTDFRCLPLDEI